MGRLEIVNVRNIELQHSSLPTLKLRMMTDKMYQFDCEWNDKIWTIDLGRNVATNGRYPITVSSQYATFKTEELSLTILRGQNFLRHTVMMLIQELERC